MTHRPHITTLLTLGILAAAAHPALAAVDDTADRADRVALRLPVAGAPQPARRHVQTNDDYAHDDGSTENAMGLNAGGEICWIQHFLRQPGLEQLTAISTSFGDVGGNPGVTPGQGVQLFVWGDPNNDGDPSDAVLLDMNVGFIQPFAIGSDDPQKFPIGPVDLPPSFFIGVAAQHPPGSFPAPMDLNNPVGAAWLDFDPGPFDPIDISNALLVQEVGPPANWMLRANAQAAGVPCGDGFCDFTEDSCSCPTDCGSPSAFESDCGDGQDNDCNGVADCNDPNCLTAPECQFQDPCLDRVVDVQFMQLDWTDDHGVMLAPDSLWGQALIQHQPCPDISYVNVVASNGAGGPDAWIVRNLMLSSFDSDPQPGVVDITFDLGLLGGLPGVDFPLLNYYVTIDPQPIFALPPQTVVSTVTVGDQIVLTGGASETDVDVFTGPGAPSLPVDTVDTGTCVPEIDINRPNVPNVETAKNQCASASIANCMKWMSDYWNLGLGGTLAQILADVDTATGRQECKGLKQAEIIKGKLKYIKDKNLPVRVHFMSSWVGGNVTGHGRTATRDGGIPTWDYIKQELEKGQDIELVYQRDSGGAHAVVVTGVYQKKDGTRGIRFKDDLEQGQAGGTDCRESDIGDNGGYMDIMSRPKNKVTGVFSESPTLEAMINRINKLINAISNLLNLILADGTVTASEAQQLADLADALRRTTANLSHAVSADQPANADAQAAAASLRDQSRALQLTARDMLGLLLAQPNADVMPFIDTIDGHLAQSAVDLNVVLTLLERGACCLPDATCADDTVADACQVAGGEYQGTLSSCADALCVVLDPCAGRIVDITFAQFDWVDDHDVPLATDSLWGQVLIHHLPCPEISYVNIVANDGQGGPDQWIVRNFMIPSQLSLPEPGIVDTTFDLGLLGGLDGVDFPALNYGVSIGRDPVMLPPQLQPLTPVFVSDATVLTGGAAETDDPAPLAPGSPGLPAPVGADTNQPEVDINRSDVPNVQTAKNQCAPASIANCMKWMSDYWNLGLGGTVDDILDDVDTATGRQECKGLKHAEIIKGKLKYIKDKNLPVRVHFMSSWVGADVTAHGRTATRDGGAPTWEYIKQELEKGQDIELVYQRTDGSGAHAVVVTGVYQKADGTRGIRFNDDIRQGDDDAGTDSRESDTKVEGGFLKVLGRPDNTVTGVFSESPTLEAMIDRINKLIAELTNAINQALQNGLTPANSAQMADASEALRRVTENLHQAVTADQPANAAAHQATHALRTRAAQVAAIMTQPSIDALLPTLGILEAVAIDQAAAVAAFDRGACCLADGTCVDAAVSDACQVAGGVYAGNDVTCVDVFCLPRGACCMLDGSCTETTAVACSANGGGYQGDATVCLGDPARNGVDDACEAVVGDCTTASECCDADANGARDDACSWCDCSDINECVVIPTAAPADIGGPFGQCLPDGFCNIHDRNQALSCFAGASDCPAINLDAGGAFGSCIPDGFCNIHDANHALMCFSGTSTCGCGAAPDMPGGPGVVGKASLHLDASAPRVAPGDLIQVHVELDDATAAVQSLQVRLAVSGGRRGGLELVGIAVSGKGHVFAERSDRFDAVNIERGAMLAGVNGTSDRLTVGRIATYTYRVARDARGTFVVDIVPDETVLIADFVNDVQIRTVTPALIEVQPRRE